MNGAAPIIDRECNCLRGVECKDWATQTGAGHPSLKAFDYVDVGYWMQAYAAVLKMRPMIQAPLCKDRRKILI